jgi:hypothetical protein
MRELYEQFIAYGRAYADSLATYVPGDDFLSRAEMEWYWAQYLGPEGDPREAVDRVEEGDHAHDQEDDEGERRIGVHQHRHLLVGRADDWSFISSALNG